MTVLYLGVDASKGYVDTRVFNGAASELPGSGRFDDTPSGHAALRTILTGLQQRYPEACWEIGVEATGGLERNWLRFFTTFLAGTSGRVYRLNPLAVKRYRERELHQSVTDPASARDLALYLRSGRRAAEQPYEPQWEGALVLYRLACKQIDRCTQMQNELLSLLPSVHPDLVQYCRHGFPEWLLRVLVRYPTVASLARASARTLARIPYVTEARAGSLIAGAKESVAALRDRETGQAVLTLAKEISRLEKQVERLKTQVTRSLPADPMVRILTTIPGIGEWGAVVLRLELGPLERFPDANAVVAFSGLDPSYHVSGDGTVRRGISKRGRSEVRGQLYMNVLNALQHNPAIRDFYGRLRERGKRGDVAVVACMAKLLRIAYACVVSGQEFDPQRHETVRARREAAQAAAEAVPVTAAPSEQEEPVASGSLQAPVSRREAQRRKAAAAPQEEVIPRERGHGAARPNTTAGAGCAAKQPHSDG